MENNHSMSRVERSRREKVTRYSVRKVSFGAASVAVAAFFMFLGNGAVYAAEPNVTATDPALAATPANNQLDENSGASDSTAPKGQADTTTPAPTDASSTSVESAPVSKVQDETPASTPVAESASVTPAPASATEEKSTKKNTEVPSTEANSVENKEQTTVKTEETSTTSAATTESNKPKSRKKRAVDASPTATTDTDLAANQVYTAPHVNAGLDELKEKLQELPSAIQNNTKVNNMDEVGATTGVEAGKVKEITEFGGWRAVSSDGQQGRFAIARKTDRDVFSVETINTTNNQFDNKRQVWLREQSFDRTSKYMLFLTKVRSYKNNTETAYDDSNYVRVGEGGASTAKAVKGFQGIEKTFRAYSSNDGSRIKIAFKTGYSGDINNTKAGYKVEVYSIGQDGAERSIYTTTFYPQNSVQDEDKTVVAAKDGTTKNTVLGANNLTENQVNEKLAEENNKPNGTGGSFTSRDIELPKGAVSYKVRISNANDKEVGLSYQSPYLGYALPVTGVDFSIEQDTKNVAKNLLQRIYDKLIEQKSEDTKWSTPETKAAYDTKLTEINALLNSEINTTSKYKESAKSLIEKYNSLNNRDTIIAAAKAAVAAALAAKEKAIEGNSKLSEAEKTAAKAEAKKAADDATKAIEAAKDQDGVDAKATEGTDAVAAVNPVGKDNAKAAVAAALAAKEKAIEGNSKLSEAEKTAAKAEAKKAADDAMVKRIEDFMAKVAPSTDHATPANDQAAQKPAVAPVTTQAAANAGQTASAQVNARKVAKELPNTGTADSTVAMVAAAASALLGLGLAGRRRKEDEEA